MFFLVNFTPRLSVLLAIGICSNSCSVKVSLVAATSLEGP